MSETKPLVGRRVDGESKDFVLTACTLEITDNSNIETDVGNFLFWNSSYPDNKVNVDTDVVFAGATRTFRFNWIYSYPWDMAAGLINYGGGVPGYWDFPTQSTNEFPNARAAVD